MGNIKQYMLPEDTSDRSFLDTSEVLHDQHVIYFVNQSHNVLPFKPGSLFYLSKSTFNLA